MATTADGQLTELAELQEAITSLSEALARAERDQTEARSELAELRALLTDAHATRDELYARGLELEAESRAAHAKADIRGKLLGDILASRPWRRGAVLRRAARVERLLER